MTEQTYAEQVIASIATVSKQKLELTPLMEARQKLDLLPRVERIGLKLNLPHHPEVPKRFAIVPENTETVLAIVSDRHALTQHADVFEPVFQALETIQQNMDINGYVNFRVDNNGGLVRMSLIFNERSKVGAQVGDRIGWGLNFKNSVDASSSFTAELFATRLACTNGMTAHDHLIEPLSIRHLGKSDNASLGKIRIGLERWIPQALEAIDEKFPAFYESAQKAIGADVWENLAGYLVELGFPISDAVTIKHNFIGLLEGFPEMQSSFDSSKVTQWHVYNAVTRYLTHHKRAGEDRSQAMERLALKIMGPVLTKKDADGIELPLWSFGNNKIRDAKRGKNPKQLNFGVRRQPITPKPEPKPEPAPIVDTRSMKTFSWVDPIEAAKREPYYDF